MSKAEDRALEKYPKETRDITGFVVDIGQPQYLRDLYIEGYHQAEKDNELTWEDMFDIFRLVNEVLDDYAEGKTKKEIGEEVLKRFKERKENKL